MKHGRNAASVQERAVEIAEQLAQEVDRLRFDEPVHYVYNPLRYASEPHQHYVRRFGHGKKEVLFLGMNPGPFGMAQTGVPFGDVQRVRDWMGIEGRVGRPSKEHPKRPVLGFACPRSEVSGTRLWSWAESRFGSPEAFFGRFFVHNYCPLAFLDEGGRNVTPDKLSRTQRQPLEDACDRSLAAIVEALQPELVIGIGGFAERCARRVLGEQAAVGTILHPSPASPRANRGWEPQIEAQLAELGVELPDHA